MRVICKGFRATPLPSGEIQLDMEHVKPSITIKAKLAPGEDKLLTISDVASLLCVSTRTVGNLKRRKPDKHPLVFSDSGGRPRIWASEFAKWLEKDERGAAARAAQLFAPEVASTVASDAMLPAIAA